MPGTWREICKRLGYGDVSPRLAKYAIPAGAYYMAQLKTFWHSPRPEPDRHSLALASYNAGKGNMLRAQRRCGGAARYTDIIACLPKVTGKHARETISYVDKTWRFYKMMRVGA
jgi:membrane-bound lytic murein transglycosylase F